MSDFVFAFHSGFRYVVFMVGLGTALVAAAGLMSGSKSSTGSFRQMLFRVFVVTLDVQVLMGLIVILLRPFQSAFIGHLVMMLLALAVAHGVAIRIKKQADPKADGGRILAGVVVALALVVGGIMAIGRPIF